MVIVLYCCSMVLYTEAASTNNTTFCLVNEIESLSPVPHEGTVSMWFWIIPVFIVRISFNFVNNGRTNHVFPTFYVIIVHISCITYIFTYLRIMTIRDILTMMSSHFSYLCCFVIYFIYFEINYHRSCIWRRGKMYGPFVHSIESHQTNIF